MEAENQIDTIADYKPPEVLRTDFTKNRIGVDKEGAIVHYLPLGKADVKGRFSKLYYHTVNRY
ncbi:hypothetical protein CEXT_523051, partial [Caerostris extrusa]